jgi:hypothetical protein
VTPRPAKKTTAYKRQELEYKTSKQIGWLLTFRGQLRLKKTKTGLKDLDPL